jgi:hypothetical protein
LFRTFGTFQIQSSAAGAWYGRKVATFTAGLVAPSMQEERCGWQRVHQIIVYMTGTHVRGKRSIKPFHKL